MHGVVRWYSHWASCCQLQPRDIRCWPYGVLTILGVDMACMWLVWICGMEFICVLIWVASRWLAQPIMCLLPAIQIIMNKDSQSTKLPSFERRQESVCWG